MKNFNYHKWISDSLLIVDKSQKTISFNPNPAQQVVLKELSNRTIILKARQLGISSIILAVFTCDFILSENSYSVVVADLDENARGLLERVRFFLKSYEQRKKRELPLFYNSKTEIYNNVMNSYFKIGTAKNAQFGRSRTITNLLLSEGAFYPDFELLIASAIQGVVEDGRVIIETTANGFNFFKRFWETAKDRGFKRIFLGENLEYDKQFLEQKKKELGRLFNQEYPMTPEEAFLVSGDLFFDREALKFYLDNVKEPGNYNISA